jgi:hypothetical protein
MHTSWVGQSLAAAKIGTKKIETLITSDVDLGRRRKIPSIWSATVVGCSSVLVQEAAYGGNGGGWLLFHQPMPRIRDHHFVHVNCGSAHDDRHSSGERLLAADREDWHRQLAPRDKSRVVDGVLVKRSELGESGMHGAWLRI